MNRSNREIIFFVLVFLVFYVVHKFSDQILQKLGLKGDIGILSIGVIYALLIIGFYHLANLKGSNEGFWDVSLPAQCGGDPFFFGGDTELSKRCKALAETPDGRIAMEGQRCPLGNVGRPGLPYFYSSISDDSWKNERCQDRPKCPLEETGGCSSSFGKQIP
jgi:hypothetical protein